MITITDTLSIDEQYIHEDFIRSSGPGGQNVNKVSTAVQLRFDVRNADLPEDVRERLTQLAGTRMTADGELIIDARRFRTQERNRKDALERLIALIQKATERPKKRRPTKPSHAAKQRRLEAKRRRSQLKQHRRFDARQEE
jgi:ribosome-associated protein